MMVPKGPGCQGCPFQNRGSHMCPDERHPGSTLEIMGQNPGLHEIRGEKLVSRFPDRYEPHPPAPYLGPTGYEMEKSYFPVAGLVRGELDLTNTVRCRLDGKDALPGLELKEVRQAIEHCQRAYGTRPDTIKLILAEGEYALYATTGEDGTESPGFQISRGISGWRGWLLPYNPPPRPKQVFNSVYHPVPGTLSVLPTYHVAYLFRNPWDKPAARADWHKIQRVLQGKWPEPFPEIERIAPTVWPVTSAYDTEFYFNKGEEEGLPSRLIRWSLATRNPVGIPRVWVVEAGYQDRIKTPPQPRVFFHNVEADIDHLRNMLGSAVPIAIEDTMYMHALLWPDMGHKLDEVASVYGCTNRWKHLVHSNPVVYAAGDALGTYDSAIPLKRELERDPRSKWIYENLSLPLVPIINKGHKIGSRVAQDRVTQALVEMDAIQADLESEAQAITGYPINLGSPSQVAQWLYDVELIHLNPITNRPWKTRR